MSENGKTTVTAEETTEAAAESKQVEQVEQVEPVAEVAAEPNMMESIEVPIINIGDTVKGTIVAIHDKSAVVDLNYKFNGFIPISEIADVHYLNVADAVQVGQVVTCKVLTVDDEKESMKLSKKAIDIETAWADVVDFFNNDKTIQVRVVEAVKGGLVADLGIRGFIPASQADLTTVEDLTVFVGQVIPVKVKEIDEAKKRAVLSHRAVLEEMKAQEKLEFMNTLSVGAEFSGVVQRITDFGVFVNIGPVDGLVHISELSWEHVAKATDVVNVGDVVNVKVIKLDLDKQKISLSVKALLREPWQVAAETLKEGSVVTGKVKRIATMGAFIEIAPGVDGLCHISELSHAHVKSPSEVVSPGQDVQVKILQFDVESKRARLSIKELLEKPVDLEAELQADRAQIEAASQSQQLTQNIGEQFGALGQLLSQLNEQSEPKKPARKSKK